MYSFTLYIPIIKLSEWIDIRRYFFLWIQESEFHIPLHAVSQIRCAIKCDCVKIRTRIDSDLAEGNIGIECKLLKIEAATVDLANSLNKTQSHLLLIDPNLVYGSDLFLNLIALITQKQTKLAYLPVIHSNRERTDLNWKNWNRHLFRNLEKSRSSNYRLAINPNGYGVHAKTGHCLWRTTAQTPFFLHLDIALNALRQLKALEAEELYVFCSNRLVPQAIASFSGKNSSYAFATKAYTRDRKTTASKPRPIVPATEKTLNPTARKLTETVSLSPQFHSFLISSACNLLASIDTVPTRNKQIRQEIIFLQLILRNICLKTNINRNSRIEYTFTYLSQTPIKFPIVSNVRENDDYKTIYKRQQLDAFKGVLGSGSDENIYRTIYRRIRSLITLLKRHPETFQRIYIYGAGSHTQTLLKIWADSKGPKINGLIVTGKPTMAICFDLPVHSHTQFKSKKSDLIVVSSMSFEKEIVATCREHLSENLIYTIWTPSLTTLNYRSS